MAYFYIVTKDQGEKLDLDRIRFTPPGEQTRIADIEPFKTRGKRVVKGAFVCDMTFYTPKSLQAFRDALGSDDRISMHLEYHNKSDSPPLFQVILPELDTRTAVLKVGRWMILDQERFVTVVRNQLLSENAGMIDIVFGKVKAPWTNDPNQIKAVQEAYDWAHVVPQSRREIVFSLPYVPSQNPDAVTSYGFTVTAQTVHAALQLCLTVLGPDDFDELSHTGLIDPVQDFEAHKRMCEEAVEFWGKPKDGDK